MNEDESPYISLQNISFRYTDSKILDDVSLSIKKNDFCLLIGPNGGGKTTLIKLLMGILKPKSGEITINSEAPRNNRHLIGYVPQSLQFDSQFPISVGEFILLGALGKLTWYGKWPAEIKRKALSLLEEVELGKYFNSPFGSLSGGQKQRATLMRALMSDPEILILDEPVNNLDTKSSDFFYKLIEKSKGKRTIVMITHYVGDIFNKADKIYVVNRTITEIDKNEACSHYPMGLYHLPTEGK